MAKLFASRVRPRSQPKSQRRRRFYRNAPDQCPSPDLKSRNSFQRLNRHLENGWTAELLAVSMSAVCIVAIAVLLRVFDGHPLPKIPGGIGLNTIVAILAATAKSLLMFSVSAGIGQVKWNWFGQRYRRLLDLELLDEASRGPLGSVQVLFGKSVFSVASLGASITLITLIVDPFIQQLITFPSYPFSAESVRATAGRMTAPAHYIDSSSPSIDIIASINAGIWNNLSTYIGSQNLVCPTGNCTWPLFDSVEWCAMTRTISDLAQVKVSCPVASTDDSFRTIYQQFSSLGTYSTNTTACEIYFGDSATPLAYPITFSLEGGRGPLVTNPAGEEPTRVTTFPTQFVAPMKLFNSTNFDNSSYMGIPNPVLALGHATLINDTNGVTLSGLEEAVLSLCVRRYNVSVSQGINRVENTVQGWGNFYQDATAKQRLGAGSWCWTPSPEPATFTDPVQQPHGVPLLLNASTLSFCAAAPDWGLGAEIARRLAGADTVSRVGGQGWRSNGTNSSSPGLGGDVLRRVENETLGWVVSTIAEALNHMYRDQASGVAILDDGQVITPPGGTVTVVTGSAVAFQTAVEVRWAWLSLPIVLELMALAFLLAVIVGSRRGGVPVWKGSILAALYHGFDEFPAGERFGSASEMAETARSTRVRLLSKSGANGTLKLRRSTSLLPGPSQV